MDDRSMQSQAQASQPSYEPERVLHRPARSLARSEWRILCGMLAASILILICTDGSIFALCSSGAFSFFTLTAFLHGQSVDRLRCYLRLEWILLGYSLPSLAIIALIPLQVQWYSAKSGVFPHFGLHLFFPAMGILVPTCLLEGYCLRRSTRSPDARDERRLLLVRRNRFQWLAWIAWRVACVAGGLTGCTLLTGPLLLNAYFPTLPSLSATVATAEGSVCFICLVIIFVCAVLDLGRTR